MPLAAAAAAASPTCSAQQGLSQAGSRSCSPEPQPDLGNEEAVRLAGLALRLAQVRWGVARVAGCARRVERCAVWAQARWCRPIPTRRCPAPSPWQGDVNNAMAHLLTWAAAQ